MPCKNDQVSERETEYIINTARACLPVPGDFVEMGCYRGDTSLLLAEILQKSQENSPKSGENPLNSEEILPKSKKIPKILHIYDSFEGLPEKTAPDRSLLGENFTKGALGVTKRAVKERFLRAGLKVPVIHKGWFSDLTPDDLPAKIAFAFLDGDFYESIRDSLNLISPLMSENSVILVHDYNNPALPGVKKAVDEWLQNRGDTQLFDSILKISIKN